MTKPLSKPENIAIAACPTCCAMRGEQCTFTRCDDPNLLRTVAKQSHLERIKLARKKSAEIHADPLDSLTVQL